LKHLFWFKEIQLAKLASSVVSPNEIQKAYKAYSEFFVNNPEVGFEYGVGAAISDKAELGGYEVELSGEAIAGFEDVDKKRIEAFAEVAFAGGVKASDSEIKLRLASRLRGDGSQRVKFDLEGEFPGFPGASKQIESRVKLFLQSGACWNALRATAHADREGEDNKLDISAIAQTAAIIIPIQAPGHKEKFGLDVSVENTVSAGKSAWKGQRSHQGNAGIQECAEARRRRRRDESEVRELYRHLGRD
jgi:hypothetical protein